MTPTELTAIGSLVVTVIVAVVLPLVFKRQTTKMAKQTKAEAAEQIRALNEREEIKADAVRDATSAAADKVSWTDINRALAATVQEERVANQTRLDALRDQFTAEAERLKKLTDYELDRAKAEIARMGEQIRGLEDRIAQQTRGAGP